MELTTHHRMLASLRDIVDSSTRQRCEQQHAELDEATNILQYDAEQEQQHLQRVIRQWEEFINIFHSEHDWLSELASRQQQAVATAVSKTATLNELNRISDEFQDIQKAVANKTSSVTQVSCKLVM